MLKTHFPGNKQLTRLGFLHRKSWTEGIVHFSFIRRVFRDSSSTKETGGRAGGSRDEDVEVLFRRYKD